MLVDLCLGADDDLIAVFEGGFGSEWPFHDNQVIEAPIERSLPIFIAEFSMKRRSGAGRSGTACRGAARSMAPASVKSFESGGWHCMSEVVVLDEMNGC